MKKIILKNYQAPGDVVMMTAAIRDLHNTFPNQYQTDVRVSGECSHLFEGNPYITPMTIEEAEETIDLGYPIIHDSNEGSYHFIHGFRKDLEDKLGIKIKQGKMRGDLYIRDEEKSWHSAVREITGDDRPFWIIDAGYKSDYTNKMWWFDRYQGVVDHFKDKIQFVQIGHQDHIHAPLNDVINLIGKTDLRQLMRLIYHADGVLTPVSLPMVLAAAIPVKTAPPLRRACVVLSGGREPTQWQMYPEHQFLHTIGALSCCDNGGCWKSRVLPLDDGNVEGNKSICENPIHNFGTGIQKAVPKCLDMISIDDVIKSIEIYYKGGVLNYLNNIETVSDNVLEAV